jgi:hypothetical protein
MKFRKDEGEDGFTVAIMGVKMYAYRILVGNHSKESAAKS